ATLTTPPPRRPARLPYPTLFRSRPSEVDLERRVLLWVVAAVVAAAGLPSLEGAFDRRSGREHRGPEVEGVGEIGESGDVRVDADVRHPLLDVRELVQARLQTGLVADDPGVLGHEVADLALEGPDVLRALGGEQIIDLGPRLGDGVLRAHLRL